jgi:hypothetical protein
MGECTSHGLGVLEIGVFEIAGGVVREGRGPSAVLHCSQ